MKKFIPLLATSMFFSHISNTQNQTNDWQKMSLNGKVKEIKEDTYRRDFWEKGPLKKEKKTDSSFSAFNENGFIAEKRITDITMEMDDYTEVLYKYKYDMNQNLVEIMESELKENPEYLKKHMGSAFSFYYTWKTTFKYDRNGKLIEVADFKMPGLMLSSKTINKYNESGKIAEQLFYRGEEIPDGKIIFSYDSKGNMIEKKTYNPDGALKNKITSLYNNNGKVIEYNNLKPDGGLSLKETYKYDDKGNIIECMQFKSGEKTETKYTYRFDDKNNRIELKTYKPDGSVKNIFKYSYEYDQQRNWIKQTEYENNVLNAIAERKIKYW